MRARPIAIAWFIATLCMWAVMQGCAGQQLTHAGIDQAIGAGYTAIETAAESVAQACGNLEPGGPCRANALISTREKERWKLALQSAQDEFDLVLVLYENGQALAAETKLATAQALLLIVEQELAVRNLQ